MNKMNEYNKKRDFRKTSEPRGKVRKSKGKLKFVVQYHYASREHYDLRLEWNGVYKSFAIPKGPSYDTKDKRLAVQVEDHPLSYGNFEGIIPQGEYGGGTVILWDRGYWEPFKDTKPNFKDGPIKFTLKGERLNGGWSLIRFKDDNWLMIKEKDERSGRHSIKKYTTSIKTGRTKSEIEKGVVPLKEIEITNPDKVIFKKEKVTKGDIVEYYKLVGERMMPFLENRLISTVRCPNGMQDEKFFMKHLNNDSRDLGRKIINDKEGIKKDYYYIKNVNGLVSEVQMNSYEFHIWGSKVNTVKHPDLIVFDLDPDEGLRLSKVREGVRDLKKILDSLKLKSYLKTSGGKGYHIFVPIDLTSYLKAEEISRKVAELMVEKYPKKYITNMRKEARKGKIFIDYFRNKFSATSVAPYSLRLKDGAGISFPIAWSDLENIGPKDITIKNVKKYLKKRDPWKGFFDEQ